jgi:hypothetical protein
MATRASSSDLATSGIPRSGSHISEPAVAPVKFGRRKGDHLIVAIEYALRSGDLEVATALFAEYTALKNALPTHVTSDRRGSRHQFISTWRFLRSLGEKGQS